MQNGESWIAFCVFITVTVGYADIYLCTKADDARSTSRQKKNKCAASTVERSTVIH